ncbi:hypothetical protein [Methyloterricola oryzae]|uniref:hypothetical protein n=1 Tax=Methyloterricola oryzae TaxID=1495050 RepID=UPI0005EBB805|nr:hypothetical protein [Methyloterricola oryzae]
MDEVFRFLFLRPLAPGAAASVQPSEQFGNSLQAANEARDRNVALKAAATELITSERGITSLSQLHFSNALPATETALAHNGRRSPLNFPSFYP